MSHLGREPRGRGKPVGSSAAFATAALVLSILPWIGCALGGAAFGAGIAQATASPPQPGEPPMLAMMGLMGGMFSFLGFALLALPIAIVARLDGESPGRVKAARVLSIVALTMVVVGCVAGMILAVLGALAAPGLGPLD